MLQQDVLMHWWRIKPKDVKAIPMMVSIRQILALQQQWASRGEVVGKIQLDLNGNKTFYYEWGMWQVTNNQSEWYTLLIGLEFIISLNISHNNNPHRLYIGEISSWEIDQIRWEIFGPSLEKDSGHIKVNQWVECFLYSKMQQPWSGYAC